MVRVVVAVCTDQLLCRNDVPTCFDDTISGGWLMLQKSTETTWDVKRVSISIGRKCTVTILCMNWCSFFFHSYSSFPKGPETNSEFAPWTHDGKILGWFFLVKNCRTPGSRPWFLSEKHLVFDGICFDDLYSLWGGVHLNPPGGLKGNSDTWSQSTIGPCGLCTSVA